MFGPTVVSHAPSSSPWASQHPSSLWRFSILHIIRENFIPNTPPVCHPPFLVSWAMHSIKLLQPLCPSLVDVSSPACLLAPHRCAWGIPTEPPLRSRTCIALSPLSARTAQIAEAALSPHTLPKDLYSKATSTLLTWTSTSLPPQN